MSGQPPLFRRFPTDGGLYRCHWAGRLVPPKGDTVTPRFGVWLHKVIQDSQGKYIAEPSSIEADKILLTFLDESIGSVPAIAIDTYWQDGRPAKTPFPVAQSTEFELSGAPWEVVRANEPISENSHQKWISPQEYPLFGLNIAGQPQRLFTTPLVLGRTTQGATLLIPPYEIFRTYFAGCTELALALVGGPFSQIQHELGRVAKITVAGQSFLEVEVATHIADIAARYLALFLGTDHGRMAASEIYTELLNQTSTRQTSYPWIVARPPFPLEQPIKLGVCGKWLTGRDRFLVYRIAHSPFPNIPLPILQMKDKQYIPILEETNSTRGNEPSLPRTKIIPVGLEIGEAGDAKKTKKAVHIDSVAVAWEPDSLPKIEKHAREKQFIPRPSLAKGSTTVLPMDISVGNRSSSSSTPRGSISADAVEQIVSRFGAFHRCLQQLLEDKVITSWADYAPIRKYTVQGRNYCAFIDDADALRARYPYWPAIFKPSPRSRLCWVVQIEYKDQTVYWLEIEPRERNKPHYALVFKPKEEPLKESALTRILNFCAGSCGQLPQYAGHGLEDVVTWVRARHRIVNDMHRPSTALSSINRLLRLLITGTPEKDVSDDE